MPPPTPVDIDLLFAQASQAARRGQYPQAQAIWRRILALNPRHQPSLLALGQAALRRQEWPVAQQAFEQLAAVDVGSAQPWIHLAMVQRALKDEAKEEDALFHALAADAQDLMALLMRGKLFERQGRQHEALAAYQGALAVAPAPERLVAELRPALAQAQAFRDRYTASFASFVDQFISERAAGFAGAELDRFRVSLDIQFGRKKRYESQPVGYFFPQLQPIEFFDRREFAWLDAIEAVTDRIRDEFLAVLQSEEGFSPYITYGNDLPLNQWAELNNSPRWSAYHLIKDGQAVQPNAAHCPATLQALAGAPQPDQPGRTPVAMFSLLRPRTRIPPHVGISNARLVTHLPLIVPDACGFRVGNQTRRWVPGQAWVFDDTIEHEAWNEGDQLRVVLIFDIWHPALSAAERTMIAALSEAQNAFLGNAGGFAL